MRALGIGAALALALGAYLWFFGRFEVGVEEQAVVLRLGRYQRTVDPGRYRFHLPPLETYEKLSKYFAPLPPGAKAEAKGDDKIPMAEN